MMLLPTKKGKQLYNQTTQTRNNNRAKQPSHIAKSQGDKNSETKQGEICHECGC